MVTPQEKIACFANAYQIIFDAIDVYSKKSHAAGADESTPLLIYYMLKAMPGQIYSTTKYVCMEKTRIVILICFVKIQRRKCLNMWSIVTEPFWLRSSIWKV